MLKDDPGFMSLTYFRLKLLLEEFKRRNSGLRLTSTGVTLPSDRTSKTPLDYVCVSLSKKNQKGFQGLQKILLKQKPRDTITYKSKMEKRLGILSIKSLLTR